MSGVAAIVFAAGLSSRMGFNKLTADLCGAPVLGHVTSKVASITGFHARILVVGFEHQKVLSAVRGYGLEEFHVVYNSSYKSGLSTSMRLGINAAGSSAAYMFIHGDMPFVRKTTIETLINVFEEKRPLILAPVYKGRRGLPVIVDSRLESELARIEGDVGARAIFSRYSKDMLLLDVEDEFILFDIDSPRDLEHARRICNHMRHTMTPI